MYNDFQIVTSQYSCSLANCPVTEINESPFSVRCMNRKRGFDVTRVLWICHEIMVERCRI